MTKMLSLLLLPAMLFTAACADDAITTFEAAPIAAARCDATATLGLDIVVVPEVDQHAPQTDPIPSADPGTLQSALDDSPDAVCVCSNDDCVIDWVDDTFGCGVCASMFCGGELVGACVSCETELSAATACIIVDADTSALE